MDGTIWDEFWSRLTRPNLAKFWLVSTQPNLAEFQAGLSRPNLSEFLFGPTRLNLTKIFIEADSMEYDQGWIWRIRPQFGQGQLDPILNMSNLAKFDQVQLWLHSTKFVLELTLSNLDEYHPRSTQPNAAQFWTRPTWISVGSTRPNLTECDRVSPSQISVE